MAAGEESQLHQYKLRMFLCCVVLQAQIVRTIPHQKRCIICTRIIWLAPPAAIALSMLLK